MKIKRRVAILGATGSIGKSTVDVILKNKEFFEVVLLSANKDKETLLCLSKEFPNALLALTGIEEKTEGIKFTGRKGLINAIYECKGDIAVNGISGFAGLEPSLTVISAKMDLALANKETIVTASDLIFTKAREKQVEIIPVDSEHSAIFSLINAHGKDSIKEIILTASGGPFRNHSIEKLKTVSVKETLAHPTWNMGAKITIDSATMANKGLEVIEAVKLFSMPPEKVKVVIHPQSIVHSMIRNKDGAIYAQMSLPDMRLPIQNALFYPEYSLNSFNELNFDDLILEFSKPDTEKFPMLSLAYAALQKGELYPAVYNAVNELAVDSFLKGEINFLDIAKIVETVLEEDWSGSVSYESIIETDKKARRIACHRLALLS